MKQGDDFYLVWAPSLGRPTFQHRTYEGAKSEAERLASIMPGQEFFVLGTLGRAFVTPPPQIFTESTVITHDAPF